MVYSTHIKDQQTQTKIFEEQKKPPLLSLANVGRFLAYLHCHPDN